MRVLKLLRHLLCLGLLLGLAGNGIAVAAPCILMTQNETAAMPDVPGCDMAQPSTPTQHNEKGKTPGCMATVASPALPAMKALGAEDAPTNRTDLANFWPAPATLSGRDVAPEPEPPTLLG